CREPRGIWTVRITPHRVENHGHQLLQPEVQWADELLSKLDAGEDVRRFASPKVIDALRVRIRKEEAEVRKLVPDSDDIGFSWMLDECQVLRRGLLGAFVLVV